MHLLNTSDGGATKMEDSVLSLITSYENGSVKPWRYRNIEKERSDGNTLFGLSSCTSSPVSEAQTLLCISFLNSHALRNYDGSHGNSSFTQPFNCPLGVGRPPCGSTLTRYLNAIKN